METSEIVRLYTVEHLTVRQIGVRFDVSGAAIHKRLKKAGITAAQGEHLQVPCAACGKSLDRVRSRARLGKQYCNQDCYLAQRTNTGFVESRNGGYQARAIVHRYFALKHDHVVHHEDRNQKHNDLANLRAFASQSDHLKYHHGQHIQPIWDGRNPG